MVQLPSFVWAWAPHTLGQMTIWLHRNWTQSGMERTLRAAGVELTNHLASKAHIAGPLQAPSGLGRGQHMVPELDVTVEVRAAFEGVSETVLARLESVKRFDYGSCGVYYEVNQPCARIGAIPANPEAPEMLTPPAQLALTKRQHTNWVAKAHFAAGAEREAFLKLIRPVFLEGDTPPQGGKRAVFLRVFFDQPP